MTGPDMTGPDMAALDGADVSSLLALAEAAAREAGELVQQDRPARIAVAATKSSPTDVVTEMDRAAEITIRRRIAALRPHDGVLGEEAGLEVGRSGLTWVVDPIDGTVNYLYGIPFYAVSVAVVSGDPRVPGGWNSIAGCVHNPASGQTWTAGSGLGAFLDGVRQVAPPPPVLAQALVGTGFGYLAGRRAAQARVAAALLPRVRDLRRIGCAAIDLCMVGSGQLDAYYERGLHPWDMAAGMLVATESGATVAGLAGRPPTEQMVVAARAPLANVLAEKLEALRADAGD